MGIKNIVDKISELLKKYRYAILVLAIGLILMSIPAGSKKTISNEKTPVTIETEPSVNEQLESVLSQIDGAGRVEVMLTIQCGEEKIYQTNQDITVSGDSNSSRIDTVIVTDANRNQTGVIKQVNPASYKGAIIVCQGAESPSVRLAIIDAVSKITSLRTDQVCVLKMK